ncbi:MAG: peptidoglycan editing factor PgeF [Desulfatiglandales bacterium]|nr:peptidoglycan editing factor PgeF [Desulfatiglandales bacterium]
MHIRRVSIEEKFDRPDLRVSAGESHEVIYLEFPGLSRHKELVHAVFTRHGGVSDPPYNTLNTGYSTGDRPKRVRVNLQIIKEAIGARHLIFMNQVHGREMFILRQGSSEKSEETATADAIITDIPDLAVMVKQADCQGIIIFDPAKGVVANVHCGWRGSTYNILSSVVTRMRSDFGCNESDLMAAIGPSLGPCCAEFITHQQIFPVKFRRFMVRENYFDLWEISRGQLLEEGLKGENIEVAGICTRCKTNQFYSYRAEGVTGRFATVAMLKANLTSPESSHKGPFQVSTPLQV